MTKIFDIIYYQAYLFYSKKLKEDDPHFTTTWGVGVAFAFIFIFSGISIKDMFVCNDIETIYLFILTLTIYGIFYYYFTKDNRRARIIKEKPLYKGNAQYSRLIAILYFGFAIAMMFIGPIMAQHFYEIHCK